LSLSVSLSLSAQCLNTESTLKDVLCHICVHSLTRLPTRPFAAAAAAALRMYVRTRHCAERERETTRLLSALPNVGHQILHISGAGIISSSPYIPH
jgi:hypothetical protein